MISNTVLILNVILSTLFSLIWLYTINIICESVSICLFQTNIKQWWNGLMGCPYMTSRIFLVTPTSSLLVERLKYEILDPLSPYSRDIMYGHPLICNFYINGCKPVFSKQGMPLNDSAFFFSYKFLILILSEVFVIQNFIQNCYFVPKFKMKLILISNVWKQRKIIVSQQYFKVILSCTFFG